MINNELAEILKKLNELKLSKDFDNNQKKLIESHIETINEMLNKQMSYDEKIIGIYKELVEVLLNE